MRDLVKINWKINNLKNLTGINCVAVDEGFDIVYYAETMKYFDCTLCRIQLGMATFKI